MKEQFYDDKLWEQLETIRSICPEAFLTIKMNISDSHKSVTVKAMERTFWQWQERQYHESINHRIYQVSPGIEDSLALYSCRQYIDSSRIYLVADFKQTHAAIYYCDAEGYIIARKHLFKSEDVADIFNSFREWLSPVPQISHNFDVDENDAPENVIVQRIGPPCLKKTRRRQHNDGIF